MGFQAMSSWEKLAEARIQEWLRRPRKDQPRQRDAAGPLVPLETQLLDEALELAREAHELPAGPGRTGVIRRGAAVELRLLVLLESTGRPLAAQRVAELLAHAKARLEPGTP